MSRGFTPVTNSGLAQVLPIRFFLCSCTKVWLRFTNSSVTSRKTKPELVRGFTVIEILIVIAIFLILAGLIITPFIILNREQALIGSSLLVKTALVEARSKTISAEGAKRFGVHASVGDQEIIVFEGPTYSAGASSNRSIPLHQYVDISEVALAGGGEEVLFDKLTGGTSHSGEIVLREEIDGEYAYETVTIFSTGVIE